MQFYPLQFNIVPNYTNSALYCKVRTLQKYRENPTTPYKQALGDSGKKKLPFKRNKSLAFRVVYITHGEKR